MNIHWMNPYGAWAFVALAAILALYILKQRMEPLEVSSTYLWRKAAASLEADRPFQKLRRNLLMLAQLLLAFLLALAIMRPMTLGGEAGEVVFVFDLSASMQADEGGHTRLDSAIQDAVRRINGLPDGARVSVLTAGRQVQQPVARSADLLSAQRSIEALQAENGGGDLDGALSLAFALQREMESTQLVIYSDLALPAGDYVQPDIGPGLANRAILSLQANGTSAVARIANFGPAQEVTVECHADDSLVDIRTVVLEEGGVQSVQFDLPSPALRVEARIAEADAIAGDNTRLWVSRESGMTTVLLAGADNIFIERALSLRPDVSVRKTTAQEAAVIGTAQLAVIDGPTGGALPEKGALLLINSDMYTGPLTEAPVTLSSAPGALAEQLNAYLQVNEIQVARWKPVTGGTPVWLAKGEPVLSVLEEDGRQIAVLGFDLHESNLPLLKEFPLAVQQWLDYLAPQPLGAGFEDADCGSSLQITPQTHAQQARIITPTGRDVAIAPEGQSFEDTNEIGLYRFIQTDSSGQRTEIPFTLHIPAAESDVRAVSHADNQAAQTGRGTAYGREWTPWLIGLLLAVLLLEWWVYRRGV